MSGRKKHHYKPHKRYDPQFQQITLGLAEKSKKDKEGYVEEM
jgi:hypothetical protein